MGDDLDGNSSLVEDDLSEDPFLPQDKEDAGVNFLGEAFIVKYGLLEVIKVPDLVPDSFNLAKLGDVTFTGLSSATIPFSDELSIL